MTDTTINDKFELELPSYCKIEFCDIRGCLVLVDQPSENGTGSFDEKLTPQLLKELIEEYNGVLSFLIAIQPIFK